MEARNVEPAHGPGDALDRAETESRLLGDLRHRLGPGLAGLTDLIDVGLHLGG